MTKLYKALNTMQQAREAVSVELAKELIKSIESNNSKMLLRAIGSINGETLSAQQLLISVRDQLESRNESGTI
ncbi:hypothetical protein [Vibrio sp. SCSIO 43155]|uniref:hypothetical protein n=1 Tax=Vibrio sp. SCSIO 43155 TaxID=2819099 RepID=UPI00207660B4|nr:hypothetical protein [Vibrio sp. SCSIO 43155]USD58600.1 hypothetical protein J4N44_26985 [Vibrio sp. SCSIO 43155]